MLKLTLNGRAAIDVPAEKKKKILKSVATSSRALGNDAVLVEAAGNAAK